MDKLDFLAIYVLGVLLLCTFCHMICHFKMGPNWSVGQAAKWDLWNCEDWRVWGPPGTHVRLTTSQKRLSGTDFACLLYFIPVKCSIDCTWYGWPDIRKEKKKGLNSIRFWVCLGTSSGANKCIHRPFPQKWHRPICCSLSLGVCVFQKYMAASSLPRSVIDCGFFSSVCPDSIDRANGQAAISAGTGRRGIGGGPLGHTK
jgi:hypothetical protein